jgi:hypothetical protein
VFDGLWNAADVRGDDRHAGEQGFADHERAGLGPDRGDDEHVEPA